MRRNSARSTDKYARCRLLGYLPRCSRVGWYSPLHICLEEIFPSEYWKEPTQGYMPTQRRKPKRRHSDTADSAIDAERSLSADLGSELGEPRSAATAVAPTPDRTGAHAKCSPVAARGHNEPAGQIAAREMELVRIRGALQRAEELSDDVAAVIERAL
jgi:hypothetical protein